MKDRVGEINYNNFGSKMIIKQYRCCDDIDVYFPEYNWNYKSVSYKAFKCGRLKCPYEPRTVGKGCVGDGKYSPKIHKSIYTSWYSMLRRCYDSKYHETHKSYIECEVCKEWCDFQYFAKWYEENYYEVENETMCLDKDILVKGNKVYSPNTCVFAPNRINILFAKSNSIRGKFPLDVSYNSLYKSYQVHCGDINCNRIHLGYFNTPHEAFLMYKINKELLIQGIANEYKDKIPFKLYNALINYEVEEND